MDRRGEPGGARAQELDRGGRFRMMVPSRMLRVRMIVFHSDFQSLLESLRGSGLFQFSNFSDYPERWGYKGIPNSEPDEGLEALYKEIEDLIGTLEAESRKGFLADMFPKPLKIEVSALGVGEIRSRVEGLREELDS